MSFVKNDRVAQRDRARVVRGRIDEIEDAIASARGFAGTIRRPMDDRRPERTSGKYMKVKARRNRGKGSR